MMVNSTVVRTFSKRQTTVESSTYGSEPVASRIATDMAIEICYTLQMLGVPLDGSVLLLGDNKSVVLNTTIPSLALKKKPPKSDHAQTSMIASFLACLTQARQWDASKR